MTNVAKGRVLVTRFPMKSRLGGTVVHTLELMHALDKRGFEVSFLGSCKVMKTLFKRQKFEVKSAWLYKSPVSFWTRTCFLLLSPLLFLLSGWQLWRAKKRWKVDTVVMISLGCKLLMTPWAKWMKLRTVWMEHHWPKTESKHVLFKPWYQAMVKHARVVVPSQKMLHEFSKFVDNVDLIPWGVHRPKKRPLPAELKAFMDGHFCMLAVCRLTVDKGVDKMVKLVHSKPDMKLILVGDGPLRERVQAAAKHGQIHWLPSISREDLSALYHAADLFLHLPRVDEAFGFTAAEAMAAGTPVILSESSGLAFEMQNEKECMIVSGKYSSLDKALKKLLKHPELLDAIGGRGAKRMSNTHKNTSMVQAFEQVFKMD